MAARDTRRCPESARVSIVGILLLLSILTAPVVAADDEHSSRTVIGPPNPDLYEGALALMAGDAEEGVRLTLAGLNAASNRRERLTGLANLCAGYVLLDRLDTALTYCDRAIEMDSGHWRSYSNRALIHVRKGRYEAAERDLEAGFALRPQAPQLKRVRAMLLDKTDPVSPSIIIDDRRQPPDKDEG